MQQKIPQLMHIIYTYSLVYLLLTPSFVLKKRESPHSCHGLGVTLQRQAGAALRRRASSRRLRVCARFRPRRSCASSAMAAASGPIHLRRCLVSPTGAHSASLIFLHGSGGWRFSTLLFCSLGMLLPWVRAGLAREGGGSGRGWRGDARAQADSASPTPRACPAFCFAAVSRPLHPRPCRAFSRVVLSSPSRSK